MESVDVALRQAAWVRSVVLRALSQRDHLRSDDVTLSEKTLTRDGRVCGVHFCLRGPRDVLLTAIWDTDTGALLCYDSRGVRFQTERVDAASAA